MTKLLLDQNLSFNLYGRLEDLFPRSSQAKLLGLDRADDAEIWDYAASNGYVLVSQDADFAELAALRGPPPKVVWLRRGNSSTAVIEASTAVIEATLRTHAEAINALAADEIAFCL